MKISVVVPVFNEMQTISATLAQIVRTCRTTEREIIVVDGGSTDGTLQAAAQADQVLISPPGRSRQMHTGALAATGELLLFLHADTQLPDGWDVALWRAWTADPQPGATAFQLGYDSDRLFYRALAWLAHQRSRLNGIVHGDQAIAVRRALYLATGGFPPVPLMEEYALLTKLRRFGPLRILPEQIRTSVRRYEQNGPLRNALRNTGLILLYYLGVSPERLAVWYRPRQRTSRQSPMETA